MGLTFIVCVVCFVGLGSVPSAAYRPFLDPLPLDRYWLFFLLPLAIVIGIVYKTIKLNDLSQLPKHALHLSVQILVFMVIAAAVLWLITEIG